MDPSSPERRSATLAEAGKVPLEIVHMAEPVVAHVPAVADGDMFDIGEAIRNCETFCHWRAVDLRVSVVDDDVVHYLSTRTQPSDLIAVGLKGRFSRVGIGSTTKWLIEHAPAPLMVVSGPTDRPMNRFLVAFDGSDGSTRAATFASGMQKQFGWPLTLLAVPPDPSDLDTVLERAEEFVPPGQIITLDARGRSEAELIEDTARHARHAMLIVGAYTDSWLHQLAGGGVTGHVLTHIDAPIAMIR
jgi:nucleotide-binding universal stress UspA family protein